MLRQTSFTQSFTLASCHAQLCHITAAHTNKILHLQISQHTDSSCRLARSHSNVLCTMPHAPSSQVSCLRTT